MEDNFQREVLDRLINIEAMLKNYDKTKNQVYDNKDNIKQINTEVTELRKDFEDMVSEQKWLKHTVLGAILTGIVGIVFVFIKLGLGIQR